MTTFSSWSYTQPLTFWSAQNDEYGQTAFTRAFTVLGTYEVGGETQSGDDGVQFVPSSSYWIERRPGQERPGRGWKVCLGSYEGNPPEGAEIVRKAGASDDFMHGVTSVDWAMWT